MPGSVLTAVIPTVSGHPLVFPFALCRAFTVRRNFTCRMNEYHDGTTQRQAMVSSSRKTWELTRRLTPAQMATLRAFMLAHPTDAFYFYDTKETSPLYSYDATGASTVGRYTVRLAGDLNENIFIPRTEIGLQLVEIL